MYPRWTYQVKNRQAWRAGLRVWAFDLVRDDGKVIGTFDTLGYAQAVRLKFTRWASLPW